MADFSGYICALPPEVNSIEELVDRVSEVRALRGPGAWIEGWGYDEGKLAEHRTPTKKDLDRGCSDSPVFVIRICAHMLVANSYALKLAGVTTCAS